MPTSDNPRVLLVRGGSHWQLQTGFRNPSGEGCIVHNVGTRAEFPAATPPYEAAESILQARHGVTSITWEPGMPASRDLPASPDLDGVWYAVYSR